MKIKILGSTLTVALIMFAIWYFFISLKDNPLSQQFIVGSYDYPAVNTSTFELSELEPNSYKLSFHSYDGSLVNGQISFPLECNVRCPVLVGISAMGRNYNRWWVDSWKGRKTVTNVNELGRVALKNGYAVVAIDARYHGSRKDPDKTLASIMNDLHFFGDKSPYEEMIVNTVKDYRVLIDWLSANSRIDSENIVIAGYSMGGQISLLAASVDNRISSVVSIVPPSLDDKVAMVAPKNVVPLISASKLLLVTSDDDENASKAENKFLFDLIPTNDKKHYVFEGDHILPVSYVDSIEKWLIQSGNSKKF